MWECSVYESYKNISALALIPEGKILLQMLRRMQNYNIKIEIWLWGAKMWSEFKTSGQGKL
jgi:hypothetical protein